MSTTLTRPVSPTVHTGIRLHPATGLAAAAIRAGRALEAWGRARALRRHAQHLEAIRLASEATEARRIHDALIASIAHAPLF